jgi:hypothetical protein
MGFYPWPESVYHLVSPTLKGVPCPVKGVATKVIKVAEDLTWRLFAGLSRPAPIVILCAFRALTEIRSPVLDVLNLGGSLFGGQRAGGCD